MDVYNESLSLAGCRIGPDSQHQQNQLEDINHHEAENTEAVQSVDSLPHWVVKVNLIPYWNFH